MSEFECKVCGTFVVSDTNHESLYEHLKIHTKKQLIPHVGWWLIN